MKSGKRLLLMLMSLFAVQSGTYAIEDDVQTRSKVRNTLNQLVKRVDELDERCADLDEDLLKKIDQIDARVSLGDKQCTQKAVDLYERLDSVSSEFVTRNQNFQQQVAELQNRLEQVESDAKTRSAMYQALQQLQVLEIRLLGAEAELIGSKNHQLALYSSLLTGIVKRIIVFNSDVTLDTDHVFTVATANNIAVLAPTASPVTIASGSHVGITTGFDGLVLTTGQTSTIVDAHTVINGSLTVKEDKTVQGNLVVNGGLVVDAGKTLTVQGDLMCDGQCAATLVNNGMIAVTGAITIKNYAATTQTGKAVVNTGVISTTTQNITFTHNKTSGDDGITIDNTGTISTTAGTVIFEHNNAAGLNGVMLKNSTATGIITTVTGSIVLDHNAAEKKVMYNVSDAVISTSNEAFIRVINNISASGEVVCNSGAAVIKTVDGNVFVESNSGDLGAVVNMDSAKIQSTGTGSLFFNNNYSSGASAIRNDGTFATVIQTVTGQIVFKNNRGFTAGICNMMSAEIKVTTLGAILFQGNQASSAAAVLNTNGGVIETSVNGYIIFEQNIGETVGVLNDALGEISSESYILFENNAGRDDAGVVNKDGSFIRASAPEAVITFRHNTGKDYGVHNWVASGADNSEILTTDTGSATRIIFIGNTGSVADTQNDQTGGTGSANIEAGSGNGSICYDAQQTIATGGTNSVNPVAVLCTA